MYYIARYKNSFGREINVPGKFKSKNAAIKFVKSCDDYHSDLVIFEYDNREYNTNIFLL